jgi:molybdenum cofactor cytidylyltransferase
MARVPSLVGVILAAGESSRMGRDKSLLPWHGETFVAAAIDSLTMHTELVIVVAGRNANVIEPIVDAKGAFLVVNPAPERGQFSSLQVGLQEVLNHGRDAAMVTLVDRPPVRRETVIQLKSAFEDALNSGKWAVVPEYAGNHGHPIVIAREMMTAFLTAPATSNAREVEHAHQALIAYVPVDDPAVVANIDTPDDFERITVKNKGTD